MSTIRMPITRYYPSSGGETDREHVRIDGYVDIDPAQILGDLPERLAALEKWAAQFPPLGVLTGPAAWTAPPGMQLPPNVTIPHLMPSSGSFSSLHVGPGLAPLQPQQDAKTLMPDCYGHFHAGKAKTRECNLCTEIDACKGAPQPAAKPDLVAMCNAVKDEPYGAAKPDADEAVPDWRSMYDEMMRQRVALRRSEEMARLAMDHARAERDKALAELAASRDDAASYHRLCTASWKALGIAMYDGKSIPEHIENMKANLAAATERAETEHRLYEKMTQQAANNADDRDADRADADALGRALGEAQHTLSDIAYVAENWSSLTRPLDQLVGRSRGTLKNVDAALAAHDAARKGEK